MASPIRRLCRSRGRSASRRPLVVGSAVLLVCAAAACGSGVAPRPTTAADGTGVSPMVDDRRVVPDVRPESVDLSENVERSAVDAVLDFNVGAGGYPVCDDFFFPDSRAPTIAPGVAVNTLGSFHATPIEGAIGYIIDVCIYGAREGLSGNLRTPGGSSIELPPSGRSAFGAGIEVHRRQEFTPGEEIIQIATYPGSPRGTYELSFNGPDGPVSAPIDMDTALRRDAGDRYFEYDMFDFMFWGSDIDVPRDEVVYGFVGYEPGEEFTLYVYRSPRQEQADQLLAGGYRLAAEVDVHIDDRGEAVVVIPVGEDAEHHCFETRTAEELAAIPEGETASLDAADPSAFCVPDG